MVWYGDQLTVDWSMICPQICTRSPSALAYHKLGKYVLSVQCIVYSVRCAVCFMQSVEYSVHCAMCNVQCVEGTLVCAMGIVQGVVCSVSCVECSVQCVVQGSVQCAVCSPIVHP